MHDIRYDEIHDEIFVANPFAQALLVYRGGANGQEAPIRVIQGPHTLLAGTTVAGLDRMAVDPVHNEIVVPNGDSILTFARDANGDEAPKRIIQGADTQLRGAQAIAVDPDNNIIVVGDSKPGRAPYNGVLTVFDRLGVGNVKPRGMIGGPKSLIVRINQIQTYGPKGWIIAAQPGGEGQEPVEEVYVGVWSKDDNGDVPPRWRIGGPKSTLKKPRGVVLDPKHKEMIVADMRLNSVLTYSFPEIF
jgi:DNA-binding beta-propeller fold protein YncE